MRVYLQTRGRTIDYAFLGGAPQEHWWSQYRNETAFEDPTILLHSDGRNWAVCLSGIESGRKDRVGTTIRYTLFIEGECGDDEAARTARTVVESWLADAAEERAIGALQAALDARFAEAFVEDVIGASRRGINADAGREEEVARRTEDALRSLKGQAVGGSVDPQDGSWVGSVAQQQPRDAFLDRVWSLLVGKAGRALLLNLIGTKEEACAVANQGIVAAILIKDHGGTLGTGTSPIGGSAKSLQTANGTATPAPHGQDATPNGFRSGCPTGQHSAGANTKKKRRGKCAVRGQRESPAATTPTRNMSQRRALTALLLLVAVLLALLLWTLLRPDPQACG